MVVFPRNDRAFRVHVEWAIERLAPRDPAGLEAYVKVTYPHTRVHERTPLADFGGRKVWYVYRDGSLSVAEEHDWSSTSDVAEFDIDASGTYVGANAAAASLVGIALEQIIGMAVGSFTRHESEDDPGRRAFDALAEEGYLESTAVVVRPDGTEVPVRYRITGTRGTGYGMVMAELQNDELEAEAMRRRDQYKARVEQAGQGHLEHDDPRVVVRDKGRLPDSTGSG